MAVPQNIEELAHQVRTAIYGKDVRESIASSMEATADVADWARSVAQAIVDGEFDEAALNTAIENKLTQLEQDYAPNLTALGNRLENVDAQLAQTAAVPRLQNMKSYNVVKGMEDITTLVKFDGTKVTSGFEILSESPSEIVLKKTNETAGAVIEFRNPYVAGDIDANAVFEMTIQSDDFSDIPFIPIRLYTGDGGYYYQNIRPTADYNAYSKEPQTIRFTLPLSSGDVSGRKVVSESHFYLSLLGSVPLNTEIRLLGGISLIKTSSPVVIQFDDADRSVYETAFPIMRERGIPGTFNVITGRVGTPGYVQWHELKEMEECGWSIASHTRGHNNLMTVDIETAIREVENGKKDLGQRGFSGSDYLTPPYNAMDSTRIKYISHLINGYKLGSSYTTSPRYGSSDNDGLFALQSKSVSNTETPNQLLDEYLLGASVGDIVSFCFHFLRDVADESTKYTPSNFEIFIDLLISNGAFFTNAESIYRSYSKRRF